MPTITYATRKSALALAQCRSFITKLKSANEGLEAVELLVTTTGDRIVDRPLAEIGGKGLFVKEIEEALLDGRADIAVHSVKDVPSKLPRGLVLACIPRREDPRDVLVAPRHGTLASLPKGARVGTTSLRRIACLRVSRPDLSYVPLRGNVDTRLKKVDAGEFDAIVLAGAGLRRLGLEARATEWLSIELSLPAVGQGALGVEIRGDDKGARGVLSPLHDKDSAVAVAAERGVMLALDGDCKTPIGAYGARSGDELVLSAMIADPDGSRLRRTVHRTGWPTDEAAAAAIGVEVGKSLR
jgi:hydroxymethylbilane synthase